MVRLATNTDEMANNAAKSLANSTVERYRKLYEERRQNPDLASKKLQSYSWYTSRNLVNTIVDSYLTYISSIIQDVLRGTPDAIRSSEMIKVDEVLDFGSREELVEYLVDRKVNSLSYGGLSGIEKYLQSNLGVSLYTSDDTRKDVQYMIEVRNINAHNRGYANRIFMDRTKKLDRVQGAIGDKVHVDMFLLCKLSGSVLNSARHLDDQIASKFNLRRQSFSDWIDEDWDLLNS
jgi:hypothetical protein